MNGSWLTHIQPHETARCIGQGSLVPRGDGLRGEAISDLPELIHIVAAGEPRAGEGARHFRSAGDVRGSFDFLLGQPNDNEPAPAEKAME